MRLKVELLAAEIRIIRDLELEVITSLQLQAPTALPAVRLRAEVCRQMVHVAAMRATPVLGPTLAIVVRATESVELEGDSAIMVVSRFTVSVWRVLLPQ